MLRGAGPARNLTAAGPGPPSWQRRLPAIHLLGKWQLAVVTGEAYWVHRERLLIMCLL